MHPRDTILLGLDSEATDPPTSANVIPHPDFRHPSGPADPQDPSLYTYRGEGHLLTVAPTGAGKGRSVIIPNLLMFEGPVVVIDPKGENYAVTARRRREMGHRVVKLDPFGLVPEDDIAADSLNPFDFVDLVPYDLNDEVKVIVELMLGSRSLSKEPFWDNWAHTLISGLALYLASEPSGKLPRTIPKLFELLHEDDVQFALAKILDGGAHTMSAEAYRLLASFVSMKAEVTRSGVLATAQQHLRLFGSPQVRRALEQTSFDLRAFREGDPMSIYVIVPPPKLDSHGPLLRLWIGALMTLVGSRTRRPALRTLFLLDEAAQLGELPMLRTATTLLRGYGMQTWSFWQDLGQLKRLYGDWSTLVNNCGVVQVFGARNHLVRREFAELLGVRPEAVLDACAQDRQLLLVEGNDAQVVDTLDYLRDPCFEDLYKPNPYFLPLTPSDRTKVVRRKKASDVPPPPSPKPKARSRAGSKPRSGD